MVKLTNAAHQFRSVGNQMSLDAADGDDSDAARWVQIARVGEFLGHKSGSEPFRLTETMLAEVVKNVRTHPSFEAGADGVGTNGVIPWDFEHGSERDPTSGSIPLVGAPAQGWTMDAELRGSGASTELWALTKFAEPAKTFVQNGQYRWASMALAFDSIDAVTGLRTGAILSSIALTNKPFIEGMEKLVASKGPALDAEQVQGLIDQTAIKAAKAAKESVMDELLKLLSGKLGVREAQDAVVNALDELLELRGGLVANFKLVGRDSGKAILEAATLSQENSAKLNSLVDALGVADADAAIAKVAELSTDSAELTTLKPKMLELLAAQEASEEVEIKADVDAALSARGFGDDMRDILTLSRKTDPEGFKKKFPAEAKPTVNPAVLTQSVAATPAGTQLSVVGNQVMLSKPGVAAPVTKPSVSGELGGQVVDLASYAGANDSQRMIAHLSATRIGFKDQKWEDQCESAFLALDQLKKASA